MSTARLLRGNVMLMRNKLLSAARRFGAGIDVSPREVRLVIVSRKGRSNLPVRVEWLGAAPLNPGAMSGAHLVDRAAVAAALSSLCARWPRRRALRAMPCAMAIPGGATAIATFEMPPVTQAPDSHGRDSQAIDEMEPILLEQAERLCGLERDALSIDWWAADCAAVPGAASAGNVSRVALAAAPRGHLEARVEAAAAAGIALAAIDGEPLAALRALAYAAEHSLRRADRYAAIWAGSDGVYGWRVAEGAVQASIRFPIGEHADLDAALGSLASGAGLDRAVIGGDVNVLERLGLAMADIGERLGCATEPFDCAPFCFDGGRFTPRADAKQGARFAVAFGLALRGVFE